MVRRLVDADYDRGYNEVLWDGRTDAGAGVPSGVYFYRFQAGGVTDTKRLIVTK
jgi:flagellar hook assembly protein FlgD